MCFQRKEIEFIFNDCNCNYVISLKKYSPVRSTKLIHVEPKTVSIYVTASKYSGDCDSCGTFNDGTLDLS